MSDVTITIEEFEALKELASRARAVDVYIHSQLFTIQRPFNRADLTNEVMQGFYVAARCVPEIKGKQNAAFKRTRTR